MEITMTVSAERDYIIQSFVAALAISDVVHFEVFSAATVLTLIIIPIQRLFP